MTQGAPTDTMDDAAQAQTPLQRAVAALAKMKARLDVLERAATEPIAVIGMGCRFPAGGDGPAAFWDALARGADGVHEIPPERWPHEAVPHAPPGTRWAGLIDHFDGFDASFFGIAPREAESMDPQQRLTLEVVWEALEDAGIRPSTLEGSRTGVFVGVTSLDYRELMRDHRTGTFDAYCTTGNLIATTAGRVSYVLGLEGPAIASDTACSSSLVSVHLACAALRARECDLALAGGVNMLLSANGMSLAAATQALSADGRCRTLDANANGFVRGEGCGMVALKRRSDAERDGDRILALIVGSAVNQDGRSTGLTAPNVLAQQRLVRQALENARLSPADIGYVEMHGTGTPLGDPIEFEGLRAVLGEPRPDGSTCVLGAVKTNLGHLESAAGVAGLIKAILALRHETIPRNLNFRTLNPRISLRGTPFVVPSDNVPWPRTDKPRRAGVSSFGISGTNAHVILEEAPREREVAAPADQPQSFLLPLSARSREALAAKARAYAERLSTEEPSRLRDFLYTASVRRDHHRHRGAVVGTSGAELAAALRQLGEGTDPEGAARGEAPLARRPRIAFVFPGQGSQWLGMGQKLHDEEPAFRAALVACDEVIRRERGFSVIAELMADEATSRMAEIDVVQPMLFAVQVAFGALWESWGIEPDVVIGSSMGECAAAYLAGALTLEDATKVICRRSKMLRRLRGQGAMALLEMTRAEAEAALAGRESQLSVAGCNGPRSTVIAGEPAAMDAVLAEIEAKGLFCRRVKTDVATHCGLVDGLADELMSVLHDIRPQKVRRTMVSTVTGEPLTGLELTPAYWVQNMRRPVLFSTAVTRALEDGLTLFVEQSAHPVLIPSVVENIRASGREGAAFASTRRNADERLALLQTLGDLYAHGVDLDWARLYPTGGRLAALPLHPWNRERHWLEGSPLVGLGRDAFTAARDGHPLIGQVLVPADRPNAHYWEQWLDLRTLPYLAEHRVQSAVVFPGAGYVEMAVAAACAAFDTNNLVLDNLVFDQVLHLTEGQPTRLQLAAIGEEGVQASIMISSRDAGATKWTRHAWVTARAGLAGDASWRPPQEGIQRCPRVTEAAEHLAGMEARRIQYGPAFQGLLRVWHGQGEAVGHVRLPEAAGSAERYHIHPALLDACLQVGAGLLEGATAEETWVPAAIDRLQVLETLGPEVWVHVARSHVAERDGILAIDVVITDEEGRPLIDIERLWLQRLARLELPDALAGCSYVTEWRKAAPLAEPRAPAAKGTWIALVDDGGVGTAVAEALRARGDRCVEIASGPDYAVLGRDRFTVDIGSSEQMQRVFRDVAADSDGALRGVVHLWSLDATPLHDTTTETLLSDLRISGVSALHAVQALVRCAFRDPPRLVLVTRGGQAAGGDASLVSPPQSALWGFARVASVEHPELACVRIDLDPAGSPEEISTLVREVTSSDVEDQVAHRGGDRLVPRLRRHRLEDGETVTLWDDATYLITGGLSGLGLALARWMVQRGARHLVLLGRRAPSEATLGVIAEMEAEGAVVHVRSVDVSVPAEVGRLLAEVRSDMPPLRGVVHSAVVLEDHSIFEMNEATFWPPLLPKALGAWNLHAMLGDAPLDFFVFYSSGAAVLGSPGQSNYAAANALIDGLAHVRRAMGLPATSVQWGPFSEVGLWAALESRGQRLSLRGVESFTPDEGHKLLSRVLRHPVAEVALLRMSVRQLFDFYPRMALAPFLEDVRQDDAQTQTHPTADARFRTLLAQLPPGHRRGALEQHLIEHIERVLRLPAGRVDPQGPFLSYGMDSLMSLEIRHRIEASLNLRLSAAVLYTYPNTAALVDHLLAEMQLETAGPQILAGEAAPAFADIVDELSENTAAAMLDEKLMGLEDYLK